MKRRNFFKLICGLLSIPVLGLKKEEVKFGKWQELVHCGVDNNNDEFTEANLKEMEIEQTSYYKILKACGLKETNVPTFKINYE